MPNNDEIIQELQSIKAELQRKRNAASARQKRERLQVEALNQRIIIIDQQIHLAQNPDKYPGHTLRRK